MKILLLGAKGQLGLQFQKEFINRRIDYLAHDIDSLDICSKSELKNVIAAYSPDIVINCAAYNNVDIAESNNYIAELVNYTAVADLSEICNDMKIRLVHFSSDYVFDGEKKSGQYVETDQVNPINYYGRSKLLGEQAALSYSTNLVFRLSWVYGDGTQNFVYKLLSWTKQNQVIRVSCDEFSVPTHCSLIVDLVFRALQSDLAGLYHLCPDGYCSRLEWAKEVIKHKSLSNTLVPAYRAEFDLPAKRPFFSAMDSSKLYADLNIEIPDWRVFLKEI